MKTRAEQSGTKALDNFLEALRTAKQTHDNPSGDDLSAMAGALIATIDYLNTFQETEEEGLTKPLEILLFDLVNIINGKQPQFLKTARPPHGLSLLNDARIGYAVATVDYLKTAGVKVAEAEELVARICQKAGMKNQGNKSADVSKTTIHNWRKKVSEDVASTTPAGITRDLERRTDFPDTDGSKEHSTKIILGRLEDMLTYYKM